MISFAPLLPLQILPEAEGVEGVNRDLFCLL